MTRSTSLTFLLTSLFLYSHLRTEAVASAEEAFTLKLRWLNGHTYQQETTTETSSSHITRQGTTSGQKMKLHQATEIQVSEAEGGTKDVKVKFTGIRGEVMLNGRKEAFDSSNLANANPMIRASIGQSVGKSFILSYNGEDEFLEIKKAPTGAVEATPDLEKIAEGNQMAELFRRSLEMGLPKMPVKVGDRWTSQETLAFPSAGKVSLELRARLELILDYEGRPHAKIVFEGDMKRSDDSAGARRVMIGEGSRVSGQVLFDQERGTVTVGAFAADLNLDLEGTKVPVKQLVTTKLLSLTKS